MIRAASQFLEASTRANDARDLTSALGGKWYPKFCRICTHGRYQVELLSPEHRKITKAIRLRRRLGQTEGGTIASLPKKPKWMRWHTYLRRRSQIEALEQQIRATASTRIKS